MNTKVDYTQLSGGLDLVSSALAVKPGRMAECLNFEQVFGKQGYRRIDGYERYDGRPEPSKANYYVQPFREGAVEIGAGDVAQGALALATVIKVELVSGSWGDGDAAGRLILANVAVPFADAEPILVGGVSRASTDGPGQRGSVSEIKNAQYAKLAREFVRGQIAPVPGAGKVLGVSVYRGDVYALRNDAGETSASLWKSSGLGWVAVRAGLLPGGRLATDVANFSGASTTLALFGCDGVNRHWRYDGAAFEFAPPVYASQATSKTSAEIGVGSKTFVVAETSRSWDVGDALLVHSVVSAENRMVGVATSYDAATKTLVFAAAQALGAGAFADWEIGKADFTDKPSLLSAHRDHLFLGYPLGQLQSSNLGEPMAYTTTAALFGMGDAITGLTSLRGAVLGVFCAGRIYILSGSSTLDWSISPNSQASGARFGTVQDLSGNALFLDDRGLTCLQATQKFGGFEPAIFSRDVKPLLDALTDSVVATRLAKSKFQYRMYFKDGTVLTAAILSPSAELQPGDVSFSRQVYPDAPTCAATGAMADGGEGFFFGTASGYVMREDAGASFDGAPIDAVMRLHFNQLKSPANKKRFRKLSLELDSPDSVLMRFRQQFDLDDGQYRASITNTVKALGGGGRWDASGWDQFYWSMPVQTMAEANIDGVGRSMGLLVWHASDSDLPFTLQGLILQYSVMGMAR